MNKKLIKYFAVAVILLFLLLYFFGSNVFQNRLTIKRDLTLEQIEKFEEDVKNGVEIDIENYVVKEKNYNNLVTDTNSKISHMIEFSFKKIFEYLLKNIEV